MRTLLEQGYNTQQRSINQQVPLKSWSLGLSDKLIHKILIKPMLKQNNLFLTKYKIQKEILLTQSQHHPGECCWQKFLANLFQVCGIYKL